MTTTTRSITVELPDPVGTLAGGTPYWNADGERITPVTDGIEMSWETNDGGRSSTIEDAEEMEPAVLAVLAAIHHRRIAAASSAPEASS